MRRRNASTGAQLSDLAFLLIIFFMILAGTMSLGQLGIALEGDRADTVQNERQNSIDIAVDQYGGWRIDGQSADQQQLRQLLDAEVEQVRIRIDENAPWQSILSLLDITRRSQIQTVSMEEAW